MGRMKRDAPAARDQRMNRGFLKLLFMGCSGISLLFYCEEYSEECMCVSGRTSGSQITEVYNILSQTSDDLDNKLCTSLQGDRMVPTYRTVFHLVCVCVCVLDALAVLWCLSHIWIAVVQKSLTSLLRSVHVSLTVFLSRDTSIIKLKGKLPPTHIHAPHHTHSLTPFPPRKVLQHNKYAISRFHSNAVPPNCIQWSHSSVT